MTTAEWIRSRLAKVHPRPAADLAVRPHDSTFDGEPVREWLLAPEPVRNQRIESEVQKWALHIGLYQPGSAHVMAEGPCTILATVVLPDAPDELVRLLSMYWTLIIAFDDQVVEAGRPAQPYLREVPEILLHGVLPDRPDVFHLAFAEIRDGIVALAGEDLLPAFTRCVTDAIRTYAAESETIDGYLRDAVANSHILPGMLLQGLRPGVADLDHLARLVTVIARLENDLLSYRKDERDGAANICWIVAREYGIEPIATVPVVVGMIDALRVQHDDLLAAILADESRAADHHQATTISKWVDACYAWFLTVARYGVTR
ncbi:terpene synthase family protein [Lentzea sp. NPDC051838]|uniref:terpene synthase family protein n=1 Tax=Lentzea sp. NPDC051838 TaxID=3154849 RepID=UPI00344766C1